MPACARHGIFFAIQAGCLKALLLSTPPERFHGEEKAHDHRSQFTAASFGTPGLAGKSARSAAANSAGPVSGSCRKHRRAPFTEVVTAGTVMVNPALYIAVIRPGGNGSHGKAGQQHAHDRPYADQAAQTLHNFPHKHNVVIRIIKYLLMYNNYFNGRQ